MRVFSVLLCLGWKAYSPCWVSGSPCSGQMFTRFSTWEPTETRSETRCLIVFPYWFLSSENPRISFPFLCCCCVGWYRSLPQQPHPSLFTVLDDCPNLHEFASLDSCLWNNYLTRHTGKQQRWVRWVFTIGSVIFSFLKRKHIYLNNSNLRKLSNQYISITGTFQGMH